MGGVVGAVGKHEFSTTAIDDPQPIIVVFDGDLHEKYEENVKDLVSFWQGITPYRQ
jgi:hypothetical protein